MSMLVADHEYGLSSNESTSANKTVLHVKLTDSALKAFEEYQKIKGKITSKANIQFLGSHGAIQIPSAKADQQMRNFKFNITTPQVDAQNKGSFDAIRQNHTSTMDYIGEMRHKLTVCANEEVFQSTRQKVADAESQSKKYCAKEIKMYGVRGSIKKVSSRINTLPYSRTMTNMASASASSSGLHHNNHHNNHHQPPPSNVHHGSHHHGSHPSTSSSHSAANSHVSPNARLPSSASMPILQPANPKPRAVLSTIQSEVDPTARSKSRSPIAGASNSKNNRPLHRNISYRDRIIHYLALRPHKLLELTMRLQKDGVREKDKLKITLTQVASHNLKLNQFSLHKHLYSEVNPNIPIYNDQDRLTLKQRIQELTGPSPNHPNSPIVSPVHSNHSQASSPDSCTTLVPPATSAASSSMPRPSVPPSNRALVANKVAKESSTNSEHAAVAEQPDYQSKYVKITSKKQRSIYKNDFNKEYDSYLSLRYTIEHISNIFSDLRTQLRKHDEGTKEYEEVRDRIFKEYSRVKSEPNYSERRVKCDIVHRRLAFIKSRIHDYDESH